MMLEISVASSPAAIAVEHSSVPTAPVCRDRMRIPEVDPACQATAFADDYPPVWMQEIFYVVQQERPIAPGREFLTRLARAMVRLPRSTPRPHLGMGDDGSIALEWNIDGLHLGIQVDPDEEYDAVFWDAPGDSAVAEAPLSDGLDAIALFFAREM